MRKDILIGSIIAVVILVLVSFTGVVGYQTTKSNSVKTSPLFSIRSKRAIGQGQKDITTDYLGYEEETNIQFSSRIERAEQAQKAIDIISKMSDRAYSKIVARIIQNLKNQEQITDKETSEALKILIYLRRNTIDMKYYNKKNIPIDETVEYLSCRWFPGCYIIFYILADIVGAIMNWLFDLTLFVPCPSMWY